MEFTTLQEIRWRGCGRIDKHNFTLLYSGKSRKQGEKGVGFIINTKIKKPLMEFNPINDRLCVMRIKGKFNNIIVINAYAPTGDGSDDEKEMYYNDLDILCDNTSAHDTLLLMGDFNVKVGIDR